MPLIPLSWPSRLAALLVLVAWTCPIHAGIAAAAGLADRPPNQDCLAPPRPNDLPVLPVKLEEFASGLDKRSSIVDLAQAAPGSNVFYVVVRRGKIFRVVKNGGEQTKTSFIDMRNEVSGGLERGMLAIALHSDFETNGEVFLTYTTGENPTFSRVSRFRTLDGGLTLTRSTEEIVLSLEQPTGSHIAGDLAFGPDGYLYVAIGDGGIPENGQDTGNLHGTIARIDVDGGNPYAIPPDNPFADGGGAPEIFAYGLRNPWRIGFDRATGELYVGDVGDEDHEEFDRVELGGNYGWAIREGAHCLDSESCDTTGLIDPFFEFGHDVGSAAIGGRVYRGSAIPQLEGVYVYGSLAPGVAYALLEDEEGTPLPVPVGKFFSLLSIAEDLAGEVYFIEPRKIFKLVPDHDPVPVTPPFPELLSETGCMDPEDPTEPGPGLVPYDVNVELWSDGAKKQRWFAIPDGTTIDVDDLGDLLLPIGSVLVKHFRLGDQLAETRLFVRHEDGEWAGYSYAWDENELDAVLLKDGLTTTIGSQPWRFPSRTECKLCHSAAAGGSLGPELRQLDRDFLYPGTQEAANQLDALEDAGFFSEPLAESGPSLPMLDDAMAPIAERARAYLHTNCSQCHRPANPIQPMIDLRFDTSELQMFACNARPVSGDLGLGPEARIIAPGHPELSVLSARIATDSDGRMPPLASFQVDVTGSALVDEWIAEWQPEEAACVPEPGAGPLGVVALCAVAWVARRRAEMAA